MSRLGQLRAVTKERLFEPLRNRLGGHDTWLGYPQTRIYGIPVQGLLGTAEHAAGLVPLLDAFWFVDESQGRCGRNRVIEQVAEEDDPSQVRH
jgi:hypothetical protein